MSESLQETMDLFNRGKATQGLICVGDLNQILSAFQEATDAQIVLFDSNPEKILEFMLEQYNQPLPMDKNSINSSVYVKQGNNNIKNITKNFFKAFKTNKNDPYKVIVVSGLDEFIELFPDLFMVLNLIIKDLKGKKVKIFLALQFKKRESYTRVQNAFEKVEVVEFENIFSSKIVTSSKKQKPQTLDSSDDDSGEIPKQTVTKADTFRGKVIKAMSIFEEPQIVKDSSEPEKMEKSLNLFKSYITQLQAEADSEQPPNRNLINKLENAQSILFNAQSLLLKNLLTPLDTLLQSYFKMGISTIGSIMPIARIIYNFMLLSEGKKERYQFVKTVAEKLQLFDRIDYALEFYNLALAISKSQEDADVVCKLSQQLAEEQTGFLARTYYYKALAAAYITEEKALIDQLTTKTEQTYKSHPAFPIF